jgi:ABC-type cobalt transport system substrate-binding protein
LRAEATVVITRTLLLVISVLNRAAEHAGARDEVERDVVELCAIPAGQVSRRPQSSNLEQAEVLLRAAVGAGRRGHQDAEVPAPAGDAAVVRVRAGGAPGTPRTGSRAGGAGVRVVGEDRVARARQRKPR